MQQTLFKIPHLLNVLPFDGEALFYPDFLSPNESNLYFNDLKQNFIFKQHSIIIYEKEVMQPRLTALCGEGGKGLAFVNEVAHPQPWTDKLLELKQKTESIAGIKFTHALLNLYRDGKDSVGWHRDKESTWGADPVIASVSLGTARIFQFRNYDDKSNVISLELTPGSLLIMRGKTQRYWEHQVPKTNKRIGARINITFRTMN